MIQVKNWLGSGLVTGEGSQGSNSQRSSANPWVVDRGSLLNGGWGYQVIIRKA